MISGPKAATPAEVRALAADPRLAELRRYVPPLSLLGAFGIERNEVAHSNALARLLDPGRHRQARAALASLLREVAGRPGLDGGTADALREVAGEPWARVAVHRERMFVDVVVEVAAAGGAEAVLGIENKIGAPEGAGQLARYQDALGRAYPGKAAVLAFLTPTGRAPTTASERAAVPVVTLDYGAVLAAAGEASEGAAPGSRDARVLEELCDHVTD